MRNLSLLAILAGAVFLLSACGLEYGRALDATPSGSAFDNHLYKEYIDLSAAEYDEADYLDSDVFALRAVAAAGGNPDQPEELANRRLPDGTTGDLKVARDTLLGAFAKSAKEKIPDQAARAQAMFECWMQEQEEDIQPDDIAACRAAYEEALGKIADVLTPFRQAAAAPEPAPVPLPPPYIVFFDFDSTVITAKARAVINRAASDAIDVEPGMVLVSGYTDTSGDTDYNMELSHLRTVVVVGGLVQAGLDAHKISASDHGEDNLRVATPDNQREDRNRRVEIIFTR